MALSDDTAGRELRAVLHEAINDLPREMRLAIVLCDLQRRSARSAAEHLGWPLRRFARRLVQARRRVRVRVAQRGVLLSVARGIGEWLGVSEPVVPQRLVEATIQVATRRCRCRAAARSADVE